MAITKRNGRYQVRVSVKGARGSETVNTKAEAVPLEEAMKVALTIYGKWPVLPTDKPLPVPKKKGAPVEDEGETKGPITVGAACRLAQRIHFDHLDGARVYGSICRRLIGGLGEDTPLPNVTTAKLDNLFTMWREQGLKGSTISLYRSALSTIFDIAIVRKDETLVAFAPDLPKVKVKKAPKWWLNPDQQVAATDYFASVDDQMMADYIDWTVLTGLRVQENLRLRAHHFTGLKSDQPMFIVPGTKTSSANQTLPLSARAAEIARRRVALGPVFFPIEEVELRNRWNACRKALGLDDVPTATPRAFRRSFARVASDGGMPLGVVKKYMRHTNIKTTEGYLDLVGGWSSEEIRRWLK